MFTLVEQLVGLALEDDRHPRDRRKGTLPAVLATGGRGAGKTAALEAVERAYSRRVPRVLVNLAEERFAGSGGTPADEPLLVLLRELKWRLEYEVRDNGRLRFPRLSIGLLVIQTWQPGWRPGSTMTLQQARQKLDRELDQVTRLAHPDPGEDGTGEEGGKHAERAATWAADVLSDFSGSLAQYPVDIFVRATVSAFVEWTLPGLSRTLTGMARRLTRHQSSTPLRWWAECDPGASGGWVEALITLALNWHLGGDYRARAERELVKALLADASAEYTGTAALSRAGRPLALLDNLGGAPPGHRPASGQDPGGLPPAGRRFLELVLECRAEPGAGTDPVVVIATESAAFRLEQEEAGTSYPATALLRVPLTALDREDAHRLLAGADPWRLPADLGRLIHRLTGGLPLGVDVITQAVVRAAPGGTARPPGPVLPGTGAVASAALLGLPASRDRGGGDPSVAGRLLRQLIPDDGWRSHLTLLSAARDAAEAQALVSTYVPQDQDHSLVPNAERLLADNGWAGPDPAWADSGSPGTVPHNTGPYNTGPYNTGPYNTGPYSAGRGDGYFVGDPFVRALLQHQLGSGGAAVSAAAAHTTLRDRYGPDSSGLLAAGEPARLYHCLARGDAGYVTGRLHASFADSPAQGWLEALVRVVAAPCAAYRDASRQAALGNQDDSARDRLYRSISRLLHAGWYLTDPLVTPTGEGEVVAALRTELYFLAKEHPRGNRMLSRAALEWPARLLAWDQAYYPPAEGELPVPTSWLRRRWQRATMTTTRKLLLGALAVVVAAAAVIAPLILVNQGNRCGAGYFRGALHECVGVSNNGYDFSAALHAVDQDIAGENAWVAAHSAQHVTVALLLPLTSADTPTVETVEAAEGAFVAQYRKNHDDNGKQPLVELVLANPGTDSAQWQPVAQQLNGMQNAPDNLRAVTGISVSTTTTQQEVATLTKTDGIPVVGGAIVADDLANALGQTAAYPGLARVEPTNREEAAALAAYGAHNAQPNQVVLVEDTNPTDEYDKTLAAAFADDTNQQVLPYDSQADPQGVSTMSNDLQRDVSLICGNPPVKWVYFAGRQDALVDFLNELAGCQQRQFTVLTGSAASHVVNQASPSLDLKDFAGGFITLEYVPIASPATWEDYPDTQPGWSPNGYQDFAGTFHAMFGGGDQALVDGQAIINYDAVFTAILGIRLEAGAGTGIPSPEAVAGSWSALYEGNAVLGASGEICVDIQGNPWNKVIPIVKYAAGGTPQVVAREYPADNGKPVTVPCDIPKNG